MLYVDVWCVLKHEYLEFFNNSWYDTEEIMFVLDKWFIHSDGIMFAHVWHLCVMSEENCQNFSTWIRTYAQNVIYMLQTYHLQMDIQKDWQCQNSKL